MSLMTGKVLLHLTGRRRRVVDADDLYYLEAQGDETDVRQRGARRLRDVRSLGEMMKELAPLGFVRIHRNHAVHPGRVREIRPDADGSGYEVRLEPPVNKVLPVSRRRLAPLLRAYAPWRPKRAAGLNRRPL
jgi:DNA-binding LytR/AlgR family response regulator